METERLRSALLSSVSHDLRTPLSVITGAISSLLEGRDTLDAATRDELAGTAYAEAERLNRLLHNLLDMTKLEAGAVEVHKEWQPLEEGIGAALTRLEAQLQGCPITIDLPPDLPTVSYVRTTARQFAGVCVVRSTTGAAIPADRAAQRSESLTLLISKIPYGNALEP